MMTDVFADTDRKTDAARSLATRARHASPSLRHEGARVREFEEGSSKGQSLCVCVDCYRVRHGDWGGTDTRCEHRCLFLSFCGSECLIFASSSTHTTDHELLLQNFTIHRDYIRRN